MAHDVADRFAALCKLATNGKWYTQGNTVRVWDRTLATVHSPVPEDAPLIATLCRQDVRDAIAAVLRPERSYEEDRTVTLVCRECGYPIEPERACSPDCTIGYTNASLTGCRLGHILSVFGKASDNTLTIFAAASAKVKIVKFTTADNGATFTAQVNTLSNGPMGTMPNVALATDGSLYVKSYGFQVYHYSATGTLIDSVSSAYIGTDVTDIKYVERLGKKYIVCFYPNDGAPYTYERFTMVDITTPQSPILAFASPSIGNKRNLNATGAVDYLVPGGSPLPVVKPRTYCGPVFLASP